MTFYASSFEEISPYLRSARTVFTTGCAAEIADFKQLFSAASMQQKTTVSGIFIPGVNRQDYSSLGEGINCQSYFMTPAIKDGYESGRVEYCPWRYRDVLKFYQNKPVDVAVVMLAPPDADGLCSYGVGSDFSPIGLPAAGIKIGVINKSMPSTHGVAGFPIASLDVIIEIDSPLIAVQGQKSDSVSDAIASHVAGYINDNATLQFGLGKIPGAITQSIQDRHSLRVISGMLDDSIVSLDACGALDDSVPMIGGVGLGSMEFYETIDNNERYHFNPVSSTHDVECLSKVSNLIAINSALEVDLLGQVNSCMVPGGYFSGPGGLPEFVSAALNSPKGRSIIVLNSSAKGGTISKIVPTLTGGFPSVSAIDADIVVTEYGVAELRHKSTSQRIKSMISIAAPEHREALYNSLYN